MTEDARRSRSTLPRSAARQRFVEMGELVVLEQIRQDAILVDGSAIAIGPFARLQASAVAERDRKTRGAISNVFGSQTALQVETMQLALNAGRWLDEIEFPRPEDYDDAESWLMAFLAGQSDRGPKHGADPAISYASVWALWLSAIPYGLWSRQISTASMEEYGQWVELLATLFERVTRHFGLRLRDGTEIADLACGMASLVEGVWLNQCLTLSHPGHPAEPVATLLQRSGLMLWRGAILDRAGPGTQDGRAPE